MKQIKIRIYPDGKIETKTNGIKGKECTDYIGILEQLLEARTVESEYTEEYYQTAMQETIKTINVKT